MNTKWIELVRLYRGEIGGDEVVEASHLGAIAVVSGDGSVLHALGDIANPTHLRSTAKPFQLLPFLLRELHHKNRLEDAEIALLMASHGGESQHLEVLKRVMQKLQVTEAELLCGAHAPTHEPSKNALIVAGIQPSALHNNCSGKHCAMVATSRFAGWSVDNYIDINHPLQQEIGALLLRLSGVKSNQLGVGVDGCSAATFILPLDSIARLYAALACPGFIDDKQALTLRTLFAAASKQPEMIAGSRRLDTLLMRLGKGTLFAKTGAEGVYAIAVAPTARYPFGLGIALKVSDGDLTHRARNSVILSLLIQMGVLDEERVREDDVLSQFLDGTIRNTRKIKVGKIMPVFRLQ